MSNAALPSGNDGWLETFHNIPPVPPKPPSTPLTADVPDGEGVDGLAFRVPKLLLIVVAAICFYVLLSSVLETYERSLELSSKHPVAYWLYVVAITAAWLAIAVLLMVVVQRFRSLPDVSELQQMCSEVEQGKFADDHEVFRNAVKKYLHPLRERNMNKQVEAGIENALLKFTQYSRSPTRDLRHLTEAFTPLHARADELIRSAARQTALGTALANRHLDLLIVAGQMLRLTDQLAALYVGKPDRIQVLRLAGRGLSHLLAANMTGMLTAAVADGVVTNGFLKLLGARAAEGTVNGIFMLRFGEAVKAACCPVPPAPRSVADYPKLLLGLIFQGNDAAEPA